MRANIDLRQMKTMKKLEAREKEIFREIFGPVCDLETYETKKKAQRTVPRVYRKPVYHPGLQTTIEWV